MGSTGTTSSGLSVDWVDFGYTVDSEGGWGEYRGNDEYRQRQLDYTQMLMDAGAFGSTDMTLEQAMQNLTFFYGEGMSYDFDANYRDNPKTVAVGLGRWGMGAWEKGYGSDREAFDKMYGLSRFIDSHPSIQLNTNLPVYRGVKSSEEGVRDLVRAYTEGRPISMRGLSSWTSMKPMAEQFTQTSLVEQGSKRVVFKDVTTGIRKAIPYPMSGQNEVLSSGSARYHITDIKREGDVIYVTVKQ